MQLRTDKRKHCLWTRIDQPRRITLHQFAMFPERQDGGRISPLSIQRAALCAATQKGAQETTKENAMRKIGLAISTAALLSAGALVPNQAGATTFGTSAGMRLATEGVQPVEQVTYGYYRRHHRSAFKFYPRFRAYAHYPYPLYYPYHRRYHHGYY
jgi:hypothetical protein